MDPNGKIPQDCLNSALVAGAKAGAQAGAVMAGIYLLAMKYSPFFKHTFNASARTALTVMPIFYTGYLNMEFQMHKCMESHKPEFVLAHEDATSLNND